MKSQSIYIATRFDLRNHFQFNIKRLTCLLSLLYCMFGYFPLQSSFRQIQNYLPVRPTNFSGES